ncbi:MAG TPA: hypothetical protein VKV26_02275 [Dehalococcoidia bacterium]|nr:hypothetical protein [Dehalococcoidia bacterium]
MRTTSSRAAWPEARSALRWIARSLRRPADAASGWEQAPATGGGHGSNEAGHGSSEPATMRGTAQNH